MQKEIELSNSTYDMFINIQNIINNSMQRMDPDSTYDGLTDNERRLYYATAFNDLVEATFLKKNFEERLKKDLKVKNLIRITERKTVIAEI